MSPTSQSDTKVAPPIIITGMHRSGTSLTASLLQSMGVNIGEQLLGPMRGNEHGHFEDTRFMEFQEELMMRQGAHWGVRDDGTAASLVVGPEDIARAQQLIDQNAGKSVWGWKDPRSSILLPLWAHLLPDARFFFVFRHPAEVVSSLLRRGQDSRLTVAIWPAFRAWDAYNAAILRLVETRPPFWFVCDIDTLLGRLESLPATLERQLGLSGLRAPDPSLFSDEDLHRLPQTSIEFVEAALARAEPGVLMTYRELLQRASECDAYPSSDPELMSAVSVQFTSDERVAVAEQLRLLLSA